MGHYWVTSKVQSGPFQPPAKEEEIRVALRNGHLLNMALLIALMIQQSVSWRNGSIDPSKVSVHVYLQRCRLREIGIVDRTHQKLNVEKRNKMDGLMYNFFNSKIIPKSITKICIKNIYN